MALNSHESKFKQEELIYLSQRRVGYSPTKVTVRFFLFFYFYFKKNQFYDACCDSYGSIKTKKKTNNLKNKII